MPKVGLSAVQDSPVAPKPTTYTNLSNSTVIQEQIQFAKNRLACLTPVIDKSIEETRNALIAAITPIMYNRFRQAGLSVEEARTKVYDNLSSPDKLSAIETLLKPIHSKAIELMANNNKLLDEDTTNKSAIQKAKDCFKNALNDAKATQAISDEIFNRYGIDKQTLIDKIDTQIASLAFDEDKIFSKKQPPQIPVGLQTSLEALVTKQTADKIANTFTAKELISSRNASDRYDKGIEAREKRFISLMPIMDNFFDQLKSFAADRSKLKTEIYSRVANNEDILDFEISDAKAIKLTSACLEDIKNQYVTPNSANDFKIDTKIKPEKDKEYKIPNDIKESLKDNILNRRERILQKSMNEEFSEIVARNRGNDQNLAKELTEAANKFKKMNKDLLEKSKDSMVRTTKNFFGVTLPGGKGIIARIIKAICSLLFGKFAVSSTSDKYTLSLSKTRIKYLESISKQLPTEKDKEDAIIKAEKIFERRLKLQDSAVDVITPVQKAFADNIDAAVKNILKIENEIKTLRSELDQISATAQKGVNHTKLLEIESKFSAIQKATGIKDATDLKDLDLIYIRDKIIELMAKSEKPKPTTPPIGVETAKLSEGKADKIGLPEAAKPTNFTLSTPTKTETAPPAQKPTEASPTPSVPVNKNTLRQQEINQKLSDLLIAAKKAKPESTILQSLDVSRVKNDKDLAKVLDNIENELNPQSWVMGWVLWVPQTLGIVSKPSLPQYLKGAYQN